MASNEPTKAKPPKHAVSMYPPRTGREIMLEERLEFVLTCIRLSDTKINFPAVCKHYGITTNAAKKRLQRAKDGVAKLTEAGEAAQQDDKVPETTEDEEA
ncbi:uncharacterized protein PGRI_005960 [Penicillium griseofulvum]|uniref:Myb-like DNA-binding domain-containing protein n=1 Tax=Penicillium patulum TaxID=5078 RepID=A0A135LX63_PENPA|nr:uncharacterized protein PGRI_005960 [Penicillium griseofulvum]KXG53546.1 hypothetical protein PGRI_005960 [Penicillium griseofulvum]